MGASGPPPAPETRHREVLRQYETHVDMSCLECGYSGLMGVESEKKPWYGRWFVALPLLLIVGAGLFGFWGALVGGFIWGAVVRNNTTLVAKCPECLELVSPKKMLG